MLGGYCSAKRVPAEKRGPGTENWLPAVTLLRGELGRATVEDNSEAGVGSGGGPPGGGGFGWGGFCGDALPAAGVASRVRDRAVGRACKSQAARRRVGRGRTVCREVGAAARARTACL